jgi:hypothetical protein
MRCSTRAARRVAAAGIAAATIAATAPISDLAHAGPRAADVPGTIAVEPGHKVSLIAHAEGVQIYSCAIGASGPGWTPARPRADLYGENGKLIGTHFAGPTWQARDGSTVVGQRVEGATVDPTAIPWLLLSAVSTSAGPDGDRLAATTFIQRVNTTGGMAPPASSCDSTTAGTATEVPYTADYYFWTSVSD